VAARREAATTGRGERAATSGRGLTLDAIVDAALEVVSEDGFEALSMRRLAARLGVGAMTLYGYVRTKEELLGELANRFLAEIELPGSNLPWQRRVAAVFEGVRDVFLKHPALIPIAATQRIDTPAAYRGAEVVFAALVEAGLSDADVIAAFDALTSFTVGATQRESGVPARSGTSLAGIGRLDPEGYPHVVRLAGRLATRDSASDFEAGLALLISGIAAGAADSDHR
jgi:AcrR family transcriptional regulator